MFIRTKDEIWAECTRLNGRPRLHDSAQTWSKITGSPSPNTSYMKICTSCKRYAPLSCNSCYHYVKFVAMHAPDLYTLKRFLSTLKQYHLSKNNEDCYSWEDYEKD